MSSYYPQLVALLIHNPDIVTRVDRFILQEAIAQASRLIVELEGYVRLYLKVSHLPKAKDRIEAYNLQLKQLYSLRERIEAAIAHR